VQGQNSKRSRHAALCASGCLCLLRTQLHLLETQLHLLGIHQHLPGTQLHMLHQDRLQNKTLTALRFAVPDASNSVAAAAAAAAATDTLLVCVLLTSQFPHRLSPLELQATQGWAALECRSPQSSPHIGDHNMIRRIEADSPDCDKLSPPACFLRSP